MNIQTKELYSHTLHTPGGDIGHVKDLYFDDQSWAVRYVVADTGTWLSERQVLLSPNAFGRLDREAKVLHLHLSKKQIEGSPLIDTHRPVSRQHEEEYYRYYGWPGYWDGGGMWGVAGVPVLTPPAMPDASKHHGHNQRDDLHLRSTRAVTGYHIEATDGPIGSVSGFLLDLKSWTVRDVVVEAGHWYSGKEILIPTAKIARISYEDSKVFVNLSKADIQETGEHEVARTH